MIYRAAKQPLVPMVPSEESTRFQSATISIHLWSSECLGAYLKSKDAFKSVHFMPVKSFSETQF